MASLMSPPSPAPTPSSAPTTSPSTTTTSGKSLLFKMIQRYFSFPQVKDWLMQRQPRIVQDAHALNTSFSYACMYFPPSDVPRNVEVYPLPKPFLDYGDFLLCHHVYDGIAVGTLFNKNEEHALSIVRDSVLKDSNIKLSGRPSTRNFAVDLRVKQLEVVEFAWMDDDSLIIACRRLVDSHSPEKRFVLSADLLFFETIPRNREFDANFLVLYMKLREKIVLCDFCSLQGYPSCICPEPLKRNTPSRPASPSDAVVPMRDRANEPIGPFAHAIGSWENYTRAVFSCAQNGSFFISSRRRSAKGVMEDFPGPKHPINYRFVCGQHADTLKLAKLYTHKMNLCQREIVADTYLYGGGLSRGSDIAMLMDKEDATTQSYNTDIFPQTDCNASFFKEEDALASGVSMQIGTGAVLSQTTGSQVTLPSDDYDQLFPNIEMPPANDPMQSQGTDDNSFLTRFSHDSPTSTLLDSISVINVPDLPSDQARHVFENPYNQLCDSQPIVITPIPPQQPRPLSTTSRELQGYMTTDAAGTPTCRECGKSFQKRGNLARHVQTVHLKRKPFLCDQCPARFGYKTHLNRHKSVHQRGNEFRCDICNRDFRGQLKLTRHLQQAHQQQLGHADNDNKIVCDVCGVSFSQKSNLSRHMQIHKGLRFFCPVCPNRESSFGQKYDLQRHIQRKHPELSSELVLSLVPEKVETLE